MHLAWVFCVVFGGIATIALNIYNCKMNNPKKGTIIGLILSAIAIISGSIGSIIENRSAELQAEQNSEEHYMIYSLNYSINSQMKKIADHLEGNFEEQVVSRSDVFLRDELFCCEIYARKKGEHSWNLYTEADIGDTIEFQIKYVNRGISTGDDIMARVVLGDNLSYIDNSTILYNSNYQEGVLLADNTLCSTGINIGSYSPRGNAFIRFSAIVQDRSLQEGTTEIRNWGQITSNSKILYDYASVYVTK